MKNVARIITLLSVLVGIGGSVFAQPYLGEKESSEMKKRRNSQVKMRVLHVQGAVEMGKITKAEGAYRIKAIKYYNAFKNANPEWTVFKMGRYHHGKKYGRSSKGRKGSRGDRMNSGRKGNRSDRMNSGRRGSRGDRMNGSKRSGNKVTRKNETSAMKTIRHKIENIKIKRIRDAAKKGYLGTKKAAYILKKIKYQSRFKDANPEWAKYGRGAKGRKGRSSRGRRGHKGGMRGQGCEDSGRGRW